MCLSRRARGARRRKPEGEPRMVKGGAGSKADWAGTHAAL